MTETEVTERQYYALTGQRQMYFSSNGWDCPVGGVGWDEAKAFCEAVGGRLPSEAEWEYAARAGTTTIYYCGDESSCLDDIAWFEDNSYYKLQPVGGKDPNAFGLYDIIGNVVEWVEDCWHSNYDSAQSTGGVWAGGDCSERVVRGGGVYDHAGILSLSFRYSITPGTHGDATGFRCSRDEN